MWYRRKTLLAAVIFTALCYKVSAKQLDMAPEAVHDLYTGCKKQALDTFIHSGLLKQELNRSEGFQKVWSTNCLQLIPGGIKEHTAALMVFNGENKFKQAFNDAVETLGGNVSTYENNFNFKSLHFLLMDSMKVQNCTRVYRQSDTEYTAQKGSTMRFGRFTTVSRDASMMGDIFEGTLFNITTCFFVGLGICEQDDKDKALISPTEEFTVEDVIQRAEYTEIILKHSRLVGSHNCYHFSRSPADVSTLWLVMVLVGFSLFFCNS